MLPRTVMRLYVVKYAVVDHTLGWTLFICRPNRGNSQQPWNFSSLKTMRDGLNPKQGQQQKNYNHEKKAYAPQL
jgi:hypothetical protein